MTQLNKIKDIKNILNIILTFNNQNYLIIFILFSLINILNTTIHWFVYNDWFKGLYIVLEKKRRYLNYCRIIKQN